jgi:Amt family ammonium transporter
MNKHCAYPAGHSFFYSGLARRKSALSLIWLSIMASAVVSFQWFFWGYSLAFSHPAGRFIGDLTNFGFRNVLAQPSVGSNRTPDLLYAVYQGMFAALTYASPLPSLLHLRPPCGR